MADYIAKRSMIGDPLTTTITDKNGTVIDLTDHTLPKFYMWAAGNFLEPVVDGDAFAVVDEATGSVRFNWGSTDLDTVGFYLAEFQMTTPDGKLLRYPASGYITIDIQERGGT